MKAIDRPSDGRIRPGERLSPGTEFKPGRRSSPETEIRSGQRLSPQTEFRPGQAAHNRLPLGSVTVRTLEGVQRAFVKVAEPSTWRERAKVVWERENGTKIPRGLVIHHKDRDSLNDAPSNLVALTRKEHALEHLAEVQAGGFGNAKSLASVRAVREAA